MHKENLIRLEKLMLFLKTVKKTKNIEIGKRLEKIFARYTLYTRLCTRIFKIFLKLNLKKWGKSPETDTLPKKTYSQKASTREDGQ